MSAIDHESLRIDPRKRADQVRERLVDLMRTGDFNSGDKLPTERQLMAMFGVGRSSVRAAIQSLVGLGIIELRPGLGSYVRSLSIDDVISLVQGAIRLDYSSALNLHEVRAMIETTASRLAAHRRTERDLVEMHLQIVSYDREIAAGNREGSIEADLRFHRALVASAKNPVLSSLLDSISDVLREHRRHYGPFGTNPDFATVTQEHIAIFEAIEAQNAQQSVLRVSRHMRIIWNQIESVTTNSEQSSRSPFFLLDEEEVPR
ncbi:MAG: FadR/GntR family transcriptional regulator [Thermomicrobiales bacterium]